jgi:putative addiction module component (TIGR02574 family)
MWLPPGWIFVKSISKRKTMDIAATLEGISLLSVAERIQIAQAILESIAVDQTYPELTAELKQELDRRSKAYDANPDDVMTREEVRASIRRRP